MSVYIDEIILLNLISDYAVLKLTAKISGCEVGRKRMAAALLLGAVYAAAAVFFNILSALLFKLIFGILIIVIAFGRDRRLLKLSVLFFAFSFFFSGGISLLYEHFGQEIYIFITSFALFYGLLGVVFDKAFKSAQTDITREKEVVIQNKNGHSASLRVYADTGNLLKDPITGDNIMVISKRGAEGIFSDRDLEFLQTAAEKGALTALEEARFDERDTLFMPVFFKTVSGEGVMPAFRPEKITFGGAELEKTIVAVSFEEINLGIGSTGIIGV